MTDSNDLIDEVLGAIDTIVKQQISHIQFDKTTIGTIVDNSRALNGEYRVQEDSTIYLAKSENTNYKVNDQVRVSTVNGDKTKEKFIVGKYVSNDTITPITYMDPLGAVMKMTDNLFQSKDNNNTYGLSASGYDDNMNATQTFSTLPSISFNSAENEIIDTSIYDTLYIQADFKTLMSNYNMVSGYYGLLLRTGYMEAETGVFTPVKDFVLDSTQMLGDPYGFSIYTTQAASFKLAQTDVINSIKIYLYQSGTFQHITNSPLPLNVNTGEIKNILVKNIIVGFGNDITKIEDNTVKIYNSTGNLQYNNTDADITRNKKLKLVWYNKNDNGQSIGFTDGEVEELPKDDDPWTVVVIDEKNIKFIDEISYLNEAALNNRRQAYVDYNIPMDDYGMEIAALAKENYTSLNTLSKLLSEDLYNIIEEFRYSCDLAAFDVLYSNIKTILAKQTVIEEDPETETLEEQNLQQINQSIYDWINDTLNRAAKKYNTPPETLEGEEGKEEEEWQFKAETDEKPSNTSINNYNNFILKLENYFDTILYNAFYSKDKVFLSTLLEAITQNHSGYMSIYDRYKLRIEKVLNNILTQWSTIKNKLTNTTSTALCAYWPTEEEKQYSFEEWEEKDLSIYANAYCVYWYKADNNGVGDSFVSGKWTRLPNNTSYSSMDISLNSQARKEEFKAVVFFNHVKYESNVLVFENTSPIDEGIAQLSNSISIKHGIKSQESYQSYNSVNGLVNGADRYIDRQLSINYLDQISGEINNDMLIGAQVYWYIPKASTMLDYDLNALNNLNTSNTFVNDISSTGELSSTQKEGYYSFYKTIGCVTKENSDEITVNTNDLLFSYRIKDYYVPSATQNTIQCTIIKNNNSYTTDISMKFSSYGTSGTDYTLTITPYLKYAAITKENSADNPWRLNISLYDNKNEKIAFPKGTSINIKLLNNSEKFTLDKNILTDVDGQSYCELVFNDDKDGPICDILEVKLENISVQSGLKDLTAYFPIPYASHKTSFIEGASTVIYGSEGNAPVYYKNPYRFFRNGTEVTENIKWELKFTPEVANDEESQKHWVNNIKPFLPTLTTTNTLKPCNMWVDNGNVDNDITYYSYIECYENTDLIWSQPILIIQNRYPSPMLNAWDGSLKISETDGTIMSTMVGAGRKNANNEFEGVLMGDVSGGAGLNTGNKKGLGLYGFNNGAQSFCFNVDGTAFLGKSGAGRLEFDGNNGSIKSASYAVTGKSGMFIDFNNGKILMKGASENSAHSSVTINTISPYFSIVSAKGKSLMHIADNDYYLETDNYSSKKENQEGIRLDLANGSLIGYNFNLEAHEKGTKNYIQLNSSGAPYFRVHFNEKNLINIEKQKFDFCSANWETGKSGTQINLMDGTIVSYGFSLTASNSKNQTIALSSNTKTETPFNVNNAFTIQWDGTTSIGNGTILITPEGTMTATGATLNDLTVVGATLTNLTVNQDAQFNGSINSTGNASFAGTATFGGNTSITGDLKTKQGQVELGGNTYVTGVLTIGSKDSEDSGSLMTYGPVTVIGNLDTSGGTVTLGGDTQVSGILTIGKQDMAGSGALNLYGSADIYNTFTIHKKLHLISSSENLFDGKVVCAGTVECQKTLSTIASCPSTFNGAVNINGTLTVTPKATFKGGFLSEGPATFQGAIKIREHSDGTYADYSGTSATQVKLDIPWSLQYATLTFKSGILTEIEYNDKKEEDETKVSQNFVDTNYVYHGKGKRIEFNKDNISALFSNNFPPASHNNEKHSEKYITAEYSKFTEITNSLQDHEQRLKTIEDSQITSEQLKGYVTSTFLDQKLKSYLTTQEADEKLTNYGTTAQIAALEKRIADLEAALSNPPAEE